MKIVIEFDGEENLRRQIRTLLSTRAGSVPVDRDFGISWTFLDEPPEVAESLFYQELLQKMEKYIPDIQIKSVSFDHDPESGAMTAAISCGRRNENE